MEASCRSLAITALLLGVPAVACCWAQPGLKDATIVPSLPECVVQGLAGKAVVMIGKQASRLPGMKSLSVQSAPKGQQQRQSDEFKDTEEQLSRPSGSSDASRKYYDAPEAPQRWVGAGQATRLP